MKLNILAQLSLCTALLACHPPTPREDTAPEQSSAAEHDFAPVVPGVSPSLPDDLATHPEFRLEWWYITANLSDEEGRQWAMQWTLFRAATPWRDDADNTGLSHYYLAHAALGNEHSHISREKFARAALGNAGVRLAPFEAFLDDWVLHSVEDDSLWPMKLSFGEDQFAVRLLLDNHGPLMLQGDRGYSVKSHLPASRPLASYYFSLPWLVAEGTLLLNGDSVAVTGQAWMDREWSSTLLTEAQQGWDWLSLHLDDGSALMIYQVRHNTTDHFRFAKRMWPDGTQRAYGSAQIQMTPVNYTAIDDKRLPTSWQVRIPDGGLDIQISPLNQHQYNRLSPPYWEGAIEAGGSHRGRGFLELTGY